MSHNSITAASIEGAVIAAALSLVEHVSLWSVQDRVPLVARYALGTTAILLGLSHTCRRLSRLDIAAAAWAIATAAGLIVAGAHHLRRAAPDTLDHLIEAGDSRAIWLQSARRPR